MKKEGFRVPARSAINVWDVADRIRQVLRVNKETFDIADLMEIQLTREVKGYDFRVLEKVEMGDDEGKTYPDRAIVCIRQDVYDKAVEGDGRAKFTMAHELGHLVLHRNIPLHRANNNHRAFENSEWQANEFAGEFLMPRSLMSQCGNEIEVENKFQVSHQAARIRFLKLEGKGLVVRKSPFTQIKPAHWQGPFSTNNLVNR